MNWKLFLLGLALAGALIVGCLWLVPTKPDAVQLSILHTNDLHAHYEPFGEPAQGGVARLASIIRGTRAEVDHVLLLDAGDQFQGSLYFTVGGARVVAQVMNELGYDAMAIGNHEFDAGPEELAKLIDLASFPFVGANISASGDANLADRISPFELFSVDGETVAVLGLTSEHTAMASSPGPNVSFLDVISTAERTVQALASNGVNKVIALTHLGYDRDLELAQAVGGIDIIVGGHSHTTLSEYPTVTASPTGEPVLVVTASDWGRVLGRLDVTFSAEGIIQEYGGRLVAVDDSVAEDEAVQNILASYRADIDRLMSTIVGASETALNGARNDVRARETNLGNLICDAMLWKTQAFGTTVAIQNGGGIRASIPQGMITMGQVLEVLPYGNQITVLSLSGAQLLDALENGVSDVEGGAGRFPQVAGLQYAFDPSAPAGSRVQSARVWDSTALSYVDLKADEVIVLATNGFLAAGGDGFSMFMEAQEQHSSYETGWLLSDVLAEYLDAHSPVAPEIEGRITEVSTGIERIE